MRTENSKGSSGKGMGLSNGGGISKFITVFTIYIILNEDFYLVTISGVVIKVHVYVLSCCLFWWSHIILFYMGIIYWSKYALYKHTFHIIE